MKRPEDPLLIPQASELAATRPGRVTALRGIIFQSDNSSLLGALLIRPIEAFDQWQAGLVRETGEDPLAMHAGLHVALEDGREFVAEQLVGTLFEDFRDGLNWTPIERFHQREGSGWDATVPATAFREIDDAVVSEAVETLNTIQGRPFFGEDCIQFIERTFGGRRLFGDSPTGKALGVGLRVADPALPLLRSDADLDELTRRRLRFKTVSQQPDPTSGADAPNARVWAGRIIVWSVLVGTMLGLYELIRYKERPRLRI